MPTYETALTVQKSDKFIESCALFEKILVTPTRAIC